MHHALEEMRGSSSPFASLRVMHLLSWGFGSCARSDIQLRWRTWSTRGRSAVGPVDKSSKCASRRPATSSLSRWGPAGAHACSKSHLLYFDRLSDSLVNCSVAQLDAVPLVICIGFLLLRCVWERERDLCLITGLKYFLGKKKNRQR